jgi:hypothetical protein
MISSIAVLAGLSLAHPPAADAAKRLPCSKKVSKNIVADAHNRVFEAFRGDEHLIYGCRYSRNRRFLLASSRESEDISFDVFDPRLEGRYAGLVIRKCTKARFCDIAVNSWDLKTGRLRAGITLHRNPIQAPPTDFDLSARGSLAYIAPRTTGGGYEVAKVESDAPGTPVVLDSALDIYPTSLGVGGSTLYWTKEGIPRSASINGSTARATSRIGEASSRCGKKGSRTLAGSERVRIYEQRNPVGDWAIYGCRYKDGKRTLLRFAPDSFKGTPILIVGNYVGLIFYSATQYNDFFAEIESFHLVSQRRVHSTGEDLHLTPEFGERYNRITDFQLGPRGGLTYIFHRVASLNSTDAPRYEVRKLDRSSFACTLEGCSAVIVDSGPDIEPMSLAASRSILYWTKGGQPYSAPLN